VIQTYSTGYSQYMLGITFWKNNSGKGTRNEDEIFRTSGLNVASNGLKLTRDGRKYSKQDEGSTLNIFEICCIISVFLGLNCRFSRLWLYKRKLDVLNNGTC
jgi:hypothetical protein